MVERVAGTAHGFLTSQASQPDGATDGCWLTTQREITAAIEDIRDMLHSIALHWNHCCRSEPVPTPTHGSQDARNDPANTAHARAQMAAPNGNSKQPAQAVRRVAPAILPSCEQPSARLGAHLVLLAVSLLWGSSASSTSSTSTTRRPSTYPVASSPGRRHCSKQQLDTAGLVVK